MELRIAIAQNVSLPLPEIERQIKYGYVKVDGKVKHGIRYQVTEGQTVKVGQTRQFIVGE